MKKNARFILSLLLITLIAASVAGCSEKGEPAASGGERGEVTFTLEVTDSGGDLTSQVITTTEATVGAALYNEGITDSEIFITVINGIRADFTEDGYWWAFYIGGEMAMTGAGETEIQEGMTYAFVCTPA